VRNAFFVVMLALLVAVVTLREGVVCCLMSLPLVLPEAILGALSGSVLRRYVRGRRGRMTVASGVVLAFVGWQIIQGAVDDPAQHPVHRAESAMVINAPPAAVFVALTAPSVAVEQRCPWYVRIGLPAPARWQWDGAGPGAAVRATFSTGVAFGHASVWEPGKSLQIAIDRYAIHDQPFHITRLGRGPNYGVRAERVDDWLTVLEIRYELEATVDGWTRLHRRTEWRRHLAPGFYFGWLQQVIIKRSQDRLLELLREGIKRSPMPPPADVPAPALANR